MSGMRSRIRRLMEARGLSGEQCPVTPLEGFPSEVVDSGEMLLLLQALPDDTEGADRIARIFEERERSRITAQEAP